MALTLRPYQEEARQAIWREWEEGRRKTLLILPTGTGKTVVFSAVAKDEVEQGGRVLILAHRGELLDQAADKLNKATGLGASVEKADQTAIGSWFSVTVGSVQTLMREKRLARFPRDHFSMIIIDEAHHSISDSYQTVLEHFYEAKVLGVTATADRGDRRNLGEYYESIAYEYTMPQAIRDGYLSPIKAQTIPLKLDLSGVAMQSGDFALSGLDTALDPYLHQIADEMISAGCMDRKTVVFLPLIKTSQKFCGILREKGLQAHEINGESFDRAEILAGFDHARSGVLCNSMLLTEGWDCPSVDCIIPLRPTKIRSLYTQMVGRGTRICEGKDHLLLLDFLWHTERHELCHPAHLITDSEEVAKAMTESLETAGCPVDIEEAEAQAASDVMEQRENALAKELEAMKSRKRKLVDPLWFEMSIAAEDLANYVPAFAHEMAPASDKQMKALEKAGILPEAVDNAGKASLLLDRISKRRQEGLATPRQIRQLEQRGFKHVGQWSFEAANGLIQRIASNNWRTPSAIDPKTYIPAAAAPAPMQSLELGA